MIQHLDLFSGIGGFSLAGRMAYGERWNTVAFCEIDKDCQAVLSKRFQGVEIHKDITKLNGYDIIRRHGNIDIITGGFPCQPFSVAGKREGTDDDRALWPQMRRIIAEVKPSYVLAENVTGIISMELDNVLSDMENLGYTCRTFVIPACAKNAPHRRDRVWIVAASENADSGRNRGRNNGNQRGSKRPLQTPRPDNPRGEITENTICPRRGFGAIPEPQQLREHRNAYTGNAVRVDNEPITSNTDGNRCAKDCKKHKTKQSAKTVFTGRVNPHPDSFGQPQPQGDFGEIGRRLGNDAWNEHWLTVATRLCGMDDGLSRRLDGHNRANRLKMLGNAIVPQVAGEILSAMQLEKI